MYAFVGKFIHKTATYVDTSLRMQYKFESRVGSTSGSKTS